MKSSSAFLVLFMQTYLLSAMVYQNPGENGENTAIIGGGVVYSPRKEADRPLRDPFKTPFEIEAEEREARKKSVSVDTDTLPYDLGELDLAGIYLDAKSGYWAIFRISDEYNWFQMGSKFRDAELVNITDNAVIFKQHPTDDPSQVREVVRELNRGEE